MYGRLGRKNTNGTRIKNKMKNYILYLCLLFIVLFTGCKSKDQSVMSEATPTAAPTIVDNGTPTKQPTISPTPTPRPSASISEEDPLTQEAALTLLEDNLANKNYSVTLLSDSLKILSAEYFAYQVSEHAIPLEPAILVNKTTGKISCLSSEGKVIAYSNFPKKPHTDEIEYDWNGTFVRKDKRDRITSTLMIKTNDSSSFEYCILAVDSVTQIRLAGIGHITKNIASFTDEAGHELVFLLGENEVTLDDGNAFDKNGLSINGVYQFSSNEASEELRISEQDALALVTSLTMHQTGLPAELSEYTLTSEDVPIIVQDRLCYCIQVYAKLDNLDILMTTFYVSEDGSIIYVYDPGAADSCNIILTYQ